jgi:hypothetical protein
VLEGLRLRRLKRHLARSLLSDKLQPDGWQSWLATSSSRAEIQRCPEPGWLIHVAYWSATTSSELLRWVLDAVNRVATCEPSFRGLASEPEWQRLTDAANAGAANRFWA